jgi:hypothetical protein
VEEMNQKELIEQSGGSWVIVGVCVAIISLIYTIYRDNCQPETIETTDLTPPEGSGFTITIDSVTVTPGHGYTIHGLTIEVFEIE